MKRANYLSHFKNKDEGDMPRLVRRSGISNLKTPAPEPCGSCEGTVTDHETDCALFELSQQVNIEDESDPLGDIRFVNDFDC